MDIYKQKYEKALENFKKIKAANKDNNELVDFIEYEYPELKESEDEDERIRKSLIKSYTNQHPANFPTIDGFTREQILAWLEKQGEPQVRTGIEWVNTIDDACDKRYSEEYAHGEYCHEQSFKWGFQEGVDWLEKQGKKIDVIENFDTYFEKQVSYLIASAINKEHEYNQSYVKWTANALLNYAKHELEKQDKQNADKVPKFKVGDWIYHEISGNAFHINKIKGGLYVSDESATISLGRQNDWRLWTVQDVKVGDVISFNDGHGNDYIELIKSIIDKKIEFWFCLTNGNDYEVFDGVTPYTNFASRESAIPATKEQCDQLKKAMADAGYKWDAEKKELKKIEQKPAWSEEDEKMWATVSDLLWEGYKLSDKKVSWYNIRYWLLPKIICLKDRVQPQPKQEWSEEEKARIDKIIDVLDWAEEKGYLRYSDWEDYVSYVKTLRPQNTWKPSDEQMEALWNAIPHIPNSGKDIDTITELSVLYEDLKKLMVK